jgi:hypothetical protein
VQPFRWIAGTRLRFQDKGEEYAAETRGAGLQF